MKQRLEPSAEPKGKVRDDADFVLCGLVGNRHSHREGFRGIADVFWEISHKFVEGNEAGRRLLLFDRPRLPKMPVLRSAAAFSCTLSARSLVLRFRKYLPLLLKLRLVNLSLSETLLQNLNRRRALRATTATIRHCLLSSLNRTFDLSRKNNSGSLI
jgi:hypothetical protein